MAEISTHKNPTAAPDSSAASLEETMRALPLQSATPGATTVPPQPLTAGRGAVQTLPPRPAPSAAQETAGTRYAFDAAAHGEQLPAPGLARTEFRGGVLTGVQSDERTLSLFVNVGTNWYGGPSIARFDVAVERGGRELLEKIREASGTAFSDNAPKPPVAAAVTQPTAIENAVSSGIGAVVGFFGPGLERAPEADGWNGSSGRIRPGLVVNIKASAHPDGHAVTDTPRYSLETADFRVR